MLLLEKGFHPKQSVIDFMVTTFPSVSQVQYAVESNDLEGIYDLYQLAKEFPGLTTNAIFKENGIVLGENICLGKGKACLIAGYTSSNNEPLVVKVLKKEESNELEAVKKLNLVEWHNDEKLQVVPCHLQEIFNERTTVDVATGLPGKSSRIVLKMPHYLGELKLGKLLTDGDFVYNQLVQMIRVVNKIHESNMVHMDIKNSNIFTDMKGIWYLGDFGSCVEIGGPLHSTTDAYYKRKIQFVNDQLAFYEIDWYM